MVHPLTLKHVYTARKVIFLFWFSAPFSPLLNGDFGAIPCLIHQLRNHSEQVQLCILQALRNLSFGRSNNEYKLQIVGDNGLQEMMLLLKNSSNPPDHKRALEPLLQRGQQWTKERVLLKQYMFL